MTVHMYLNGEWLVRDWFGNKACLNDISGACISRNETHKNDVLLYCQAKAKECADNVAMLDRESAELIWRLLELLLKQNGVSWGAVASGVCWGCSARVHFSCSMFCRCSGKSMCAPPYLPKIFLVLPLEQFLCLWLKGREGVGGGGGSSNFDWVAWVTELTVFLFLLCTEFWVFFKMWLIS